MKYAVRLPLLYLMLSLLLPTGTTLAQPVSKWLLSLGSGMAVYQGDVSRAGFGTLQGHTMIWGGQMAYRPNPRWSVGLQAHHGELMAADGFYPGDAYRSARKFRFSTELSDVALDVRFFPLPHRRLQPIIGTGVGQVFFKTSAYLLDNTHLELFDYIKEDERSEVDQALFIPLNLGFDYQVSPGISFHAGLQYNFTFTDFLDGVSFSGNPNKNDNYGQLYLGMTFHLGHTSDIDQDGIPDSEDQCPLKPGTVRSGGCPDSDGDGLRDSDDRCPLAAGSPELYGCPDTDGDGTADPFDRCPTQAGPPESLGCPPMDSDGDGVLDHLDDCPLQPGPVSRRGCPAIDSDQDGILDEDDHCPHHFGLPLFDGCPDSDGDGIEDIKDACPNTFGLFTAQGCPLFANPEEEAQVLSNQLLYFRPNSADVSNFMLLDKLRDFLRQHPDYHLMINGHADGSGSEDNTGYLSLLRAERVRRYLEDTGANPDQLAVRGFSGREPRGAGTSPADQAQNRRVAFRMERGG
jgi:OmpA-OmpF porin, OOP family